MKGSNLKKQKANLQKFIAVRDEIHSKGGNHCSITLQLTFMESNLQEIPAIVKFAMESGCDRVKGHHLWTHNRPEMEQENLRRSPDSIRRWNKIAAECHEIAKGREGFRLENFLELDPMKAGAGSDITPDAKCPFLGEEAWVNAEGVFSPCCAPDEERKALGSFGVVESSGDEGSLGRVWKSQEYQVTPLCITEISGNPPVLGDIITPT